MQRIGQINNQLNPSSDFQLTLDGGCLTREEREFYEKNGYIVVKKMFSDDDISRWVERFKEYADGKLEKKYGMQVVRDISLAKKGGSQAMGEAAITKIQDWQEDDVLFTFLSHPKMQPYLKSFCGANYKSVHTMFINKPPHMGSSSMHSIHQDILYFPFRPADRIVAGWSAMETANKNNGSLVIYPGSHKLGPVEHGYPDWKEGVNKAYWGIKQMPPPEAPKIVLEMDKGDIVFFHPYLLHGSGENKSQGYRKSICCHFANASCKYIDIKGTFHEELAKDVMSYAQRKFGGQNMQYEDIWRFKCRLIEGESDPNGL